MGERGLVFKGTEFQSGKTKKFWRRMGTTVHSNVKVLNDTELNT